MSMSPETTAQADSETAAQAEVATEGVVSMDKIRIPFIGKKDTKGFDYYYTTTRVPVMLDLSNSVIHLFPYEKDGGEFGLDLVLRRYDPDKRRADVVDTPRPLRRRSRSRSLETDGE